MTTGAPKANNSGKDGVIIIFASSDTFLHAVLYTLNKSGSLVIKKHGLSTKRISLTDLIRNHPHQNRQRGPLPILMP